MNHKIVTVQAGLHRGHVYIYIYIWQSLKSTVSSSNPSAHLEIVPT